MYILASVFPVVPSVSREPFDRLETIGWCSHQPRLAWHSVRSSRNSHLASHGPKRYIVFHSVVHRANDPVADPAPVPLMRSRRFFVNFFLLTSGTACSSYARFIHVRAHSINMYCICTYAKCSINITCVVLRCGAMHLFRVTIV